jgi:Lipopolysaccharide-assembly
LARKLSWLLGCMLGAMCLAGCGYQFAAAGTGFPKNAKTIYVARFSNTSRFTGVNDKFMRYLKDEIADHKRLQLVDSPKQADLVLTGDILSVDTRPTGFNNAMEASLYQQDMVVQAQLRDRHTKQVLWSNVMNSFDQFPTVSSTVITTSPTFLQQNLRSQDIASMPDLQVAQTQQAASTQQMMTDMARELYASMSEGF